MKTYVCVRCGKEFEAAHKTAACPECHVAVCVVCGKQFKLTHPYTQQTCSSKCRGIYRKQSGIAKQVAEKAKLTNIQKYGQSNVSGLHTFTKVCKFCGKTFQTTSSRRVYCTEDHYKPCPVCGKPVKILDLTSDYVPTCSYACRQIRIETTNMQKYGNPISLNSKHGRELAKQTCMKKYGVLHPSQSEEVKAKVKATNLKRFGVSYPMQNVEVQEKAKCTNLQKYGVAYPSQLESVKQKALETMMRNYGGIGLQSPMLQLKVEATNLQKYGCKYPIQNPEIKQKIFESIVSKYGGLGAASEQIRKKIQNTSRYKYGTDWPSQAEIVKSKVKATSISNYGVSNVFMSETIKAKIHQSIQDKYGVDNPMKSAKVRERAKQTCLDRYGNEYYNTSKLRLSRTMSNPEKLEAYYDFRISPCQYIETHYENLPTLSELSEDLGVEVSTISFHILNSNASHLIRHCKSTMEDEVCELISAFAPGLHICRNDRTVIAPKELDIYIPSLNLAFECNPTFTHNSSVPDIWNGKLMHYKYHQEKSFAAANKNVFLFHIFGYEWVHKKDIIISMIQNLLKCTSNKIYARNTYVCELQNSECVEFLSKNHRQGSILAPIRLGLKLKETDELVSVMTFGRLRSTMGHNHDIDSNVFELSRFCNKLNTNVVGGASKLFKYFCKNHDFNKVISFSDISHTKGQLYEVLGFKQEIKKNIAPGYVWVNAKDDSYLHRVQCQKNKLRKLFNEPDLDIEHNTENVIMEVHNYVKVYDSGVYKWVYTKN